MRVTRGEGDEGAQLRDQLGLCDQLPDQQVHSEDEPESDCDLRCTPRGERQSVQHQYCQPGATASLE